MSETAASKPGPLRTVWKILRPEQSGRQVNSPETEPVLPIRDEQTARPGVSGGVEAGRRVEEECNTERQARSA